MADYVGNEWQKETEISTQNGTSRSRERTINPANGLVTAVTSWGLTRPISYPHDDFGVYQETDALGQTVVYTRDQRGKVTSETTSSGKTETKLYDGFGRIIVNLGDLHRTYPYLALSAESLRVRHPHWQIGFRHWHQASTSPV